MTGLTNNWKKNKRQIEMTIVHLNRFQIRAVRKDTKISELSLDNIFSKVILPLWVSLLEVEFNILISENVHFTKDFTTKHQISEENLIDKWLLLNEFFFKNKYLRRQDKELNALNLGMTTYSRYKTIVTIIDEDLRPFIELRNKLSHGQWAVAMNVIGSNKNQKLTTKIWKLSKKEIMLIKSLVVNLPCLMKFLITSKMTFEREYDKYIYKLLKAKNDADLKFEWLRKKETSKTKDISKKDKKARTGSGL